MGIHWLMEVKEERSRSSSFGESTTPPVSRRLFTLTRLRSGTRSSHSQLGVIRSVTRSLSLYSLPTASPDDQPFP